MACKDCKAMADALAAVIAGLDLAASSPAMFRDRIIRGLRDAAMKGLQPRKEKP